MLLLSAGHFFLMFKGKALIVKKLEEVTNRKVTISYFNILPLFDLEIDNLNIEGLMKADIVFLSPSILFALTGNTAFNSLRIIRPVINWEFSSYEPDETIIEAAPAKGTSADVIVSSSAEFPEVQKNQPLHFIVKQLNISNGKINLFDKTPQPDGIKIRLQNVNLNLTNLYLFPISAITQFDLKGRIPWKTGKEEGKIRAHGWMNLQKKDMDAVLEIKDIDGIYLYPYYSQWIDLEKARIQSANLKFTSKIRGINNNLVADCHLELTDIVRKPLGPDETEKTASKIADAVLDMFKSLDQGRVALDFSVKTKMDKPRFGLGTIKTAVENKLSKAQKEDGAVKSVLKFPGRLLEGTVEGATDVSKAVLEGTFAIGNEFRKAIKDSFKK